MLSFALPDFLGSRSFFTLTEAQVLIREWCLDYNDFLPHRSLDDLTPNEFARRQIP